MNKIKNKIAFLVLGVGLVISTVLVWASTYSDTFTTLSNYLLSDSSRLTVASGAAKLIPQKPFHIHNTKAKFEGTGYAYGDTEFHTTNVGTSQSPIKIGDTGLVSVWRLNETTGATVSDAKGAGGNGTAANMENGDWKAGKFGNGLDFGGTDERVALTDFADPSSFTLEAWVRPASVTGTQALIEKMNSSTSGFGLFLSGNKAQAVANAASPATGVTVLSAGTWYHLAATYDGTNLKVYVDGVEDASTTAASLTFNTGTTLAYLAARSYNDSAYQDYYTGMMDDVTYFNTALSAAVIASHAASGARIHMKTALTPHAPMLDRTLPGLVAYWPMNESSGTTSTSDLALANIGTLANMVGGDHVAGINKNGLNFNGSNKYVSVANHASLNPTTNKLWTLSAWIKTSSSNGPVICKGTSGTNGYELGVDNNGKAVFKKSAVAPLVSTTTVTDGAWHHIAGVSDAAGMKLYVDGVLEPSNSDTSNYVSQSASLYIGYSTGSSTYFNGTIDEVAIFSRALVAGEISYLAGKRGEFATFTSPVMDGEITTGTWDKLTTGVKNVKGGFAFSNIKDLGNASFRDFADLDADGDLDALVAIWAGGLGLRRNDGLGNFATWTTFGTAGTDAAVGVDIDGDGDNDAVGAFAATPEVAWYENTNGAGTFSAKQTIDNAYAAVWLTSGDMDNDGTRDLVGVTASTVKIWRNTTGTGDAGSWTGVSVATGLSNVSKPLVADMDGDGNMDIVTNNGSSAVWWKGDGAGGFGATQTITGALAQSNARVVVADFDGDGDMDVAGNSNVTCCNGEVAWWKNNNGLGTSWTKIQLEVYYTSSAVIIIAADLDNDGNTDLIVGGGDSSTQARFYKNDGTGTGNILIKQTTFAVPNPTNTTGLVADLNGDGNLDFADQGGSIAMIQVPWKPTAAPTGVSGWDQVTRFVPADFDNDGVLDFALANDSQNELTWYRGTGTGTFDNERVIQSGTDGFNNGFSALLNMVAAYDINADGYMDVVAAAGAAVDEIAWWQNDGTPSDGGWTKRSIRTSYGNTRYVGVTDLDNNGKPDVVTLTDMGNGELAYFNDDDGDNTWTLNVIENSAGLNTNGTYYAVLADLDSDGKMDIIAGDLTSGGANPIYWWRQTSNSPLTFAAKTQIATGQFGFFVGDVDGDGLLDVSDTDYNANGGWKRQTTPGTFGSRNVLFSSTYLGLAVVTDIDGDGDADILREPINAGVTVQLYENDGTPLDGGWRNQGYITAVGGFSSLGSSTLIVADLNQDGLLDLIDNNYQGAISIWVQQPWTSVKFQFRADSNASPTTSYLGPSGTAGTYYSSGGGIGPDANRYAQYQASFYRTDPTLDPQLASVQTKYTALNYSTANPYVQPTGSTAMTYMTGFTETATKPAGSAIQYVLTPDGGVTWYYWNGSNWVTSTGAYAQSNTGATINTNIAQFDDAMYAAGQLAQNSTMNLKFRAFLNSDGAALPELDQLDIVHETGTVTVTSPNGSEYVKAGVARSVTWTSTGVLPANNLTLEYSKDNFVGDVQSMATGEANDGTYSWTVPNDPSSTVRVLVRSAGVPAIQDRSNNNFTLFALNLTAPNGSETWTAGSTQSVTWTQAGLPGATVKLQISSDAPHAVWNDIAGATGLAKAAGSYGWTVPNTLSSTVRLRICDESQCANVQDDSNADFSIIGSVITVDQPTGATVWAFNTTQTIRWSVAGPIPSGGTVSLYYSINDGSTWTAVATGSQVDATTGAAGISWPIPSNAVSSQARIKIEDDPTWNTIGGQNAVDGVSAQYKVTAKIDVTSPNGGEKWAAGQAHTISWQTQGSIANVNVYYSTAGAGGPWTLISGPIANAGSLSWTPAANLAGANTFVRVVNAADSDNLDPSNAAFSVTTVAVTTPSNSSLRYLAGSSQTNLIKWTSTAVSNVKIEYSSAGNSGPWTTIVASEPSANGGTGVTWNVPNLTTTNYFIRITDADAVPPANGADTALAFDLSDNAFSVYGTITVVAPNTVSLDWPAGQNQTITWTTSPANASVIQNVKIEVQDFINNPGVWTQITASTPAQNVGAGSGSTTWVPNFTTSNAKIRIVDVSDAASVSVVGSTQFFSLSGLSITTPSGGESWTVGTTQVMNFSSTGTMSNVRLEYQVNGGSYTVFANGSIETSTNGSSYTPYVGNGSNVPAAGNPLYVRWTVPDAISSTNQAKIKITNLTNSAFAETNGLTITGALAMTTPATLTVGQSASLSWTKTGTIGTVTVQLSPSGNFSGDEVTVGTGLTGTSTNWTVTNNIGPTGRLRVTDTVAGHPPTISTSNAFAIRGDFAFTAPIVSTGWGVQENRSVTWSNTGTMSNVTLEYATDVDGYTAWTAIASNTANAGSLPWNNIPDLVILGGNNPNPPAPLANPTNGRRNVRLRLTDTSPGHTGASAVQTVSPTFNIKYYLLTFGVINENGGNLTGLSALDSIDWNVVDTLISPSQTKRHYKADTGLQATWSKTGYTASTVTYNADADKSVSVVLESDTPVPFDVKLLTAYNSTTDRLSLTLSLSKSGTSVTNAAVLGASTVTIYDTDGVTQIAALTLPTPDANGLYKYADLTPATYSMTSGNSYLTRCTIVYNGVTKTSMNIINFTSEAKTKQILDALGAVGDAAGADTIFGKIKETTNAANGAQTAATNAQNSGTAIQAALGTVNDTAAQNTMFGRQSAVLSSLGTLSDGGNSQKTLQARLADFDSKGVKASGGGLLQRSLNVAPGQSVPIRYQAGTGLAPTADIYDADNKLVASAVPLAEIANTGVYEYKWTPDKKAGVGDYTVMVKEASTGSLSSMQMRVGGEAAGGSAGGGAVAAVPAETAKTSPFTSKLDNMMERLKDAQAVKAAEGDTQAESDATAANTVVIQDARVGIAETRSQAEKLAKELGIDLGSLMDLTKEQEVEMKAQSEQMKVLKNHVERMRAILEAMRMTVGTDRPVVTDWMEAGSVILKVLAINPSKELEQEVPLKTYLPIEAKPEHVLNLDELELQFDTQKSMYYVEKKVKLKPGESYTLMVHIEDIWMIPAEKMANARARADKTIMMLEGTASYDLAKLLYDNFVSTLALIESKQSDESLLPQQHIAAYRANIKMLEDSLRDLNAMEAMLVSSTDKANATAGPLVSVAFTWKLMLGIIGFLALLSFGSFLVWQRQIRVMVQPKEIDLAAPEERGTPGTPSGLT